MPKNVAIFFTGQVVTVAPSLKSSLRMTLPRTMLTPIHLRIMLSRFQHRPGTGGKLAEVFAVGGHVIASDFVNFVIAVGLGVGVDEIMVHGRLG